MGQQTRPVIGINPDYTAPTKTKQGRIILDEGYYDAVLAAGGLPVVMPPINAEPEINAFLDRVDGFILTGGLDMDPRRFGQPQHAATERMPERRETNDKTLIQALRERELPTLGIGLGMQQLNIAFGGTLYLHLPEDLPRAMPHVDPYEEGPHRHLVTIEANTRLDDIYGGGELRVNSHHHQAVNQVAPKWRVGAKAPDGVIEAIELDDPTWFCLGVQWHPESDTATALDMQLFECFIQACIRHAQPLQLAA
ncbi:MAG: gamma-glutamyl-gamma-aminobutyrate hydrolase family protein [Gemmataceae bacterium]